MGGAGEHHLLGGRTRGLSRYSPHPADLRWMPPPLYGARGQPSATRSVSAPVTQWRGPQVQAWQPPRPRGKAPADPPAPTDGWPWMGLGDTVSASSFSPLQQKRAHPRGPEGTSPRSPAPCLGAAVPQRPGSRPLPLGCRGFLAAPREACEDVKAAPRGVPVEPPPLQRPEPSTAWAQHGAVSARSTSPLN